MTTRQLAALLKQIHSTPPDFDDESLAPEVDRAVLVSPVNRELSTDESRRVYRLVYSFKSWYDAHNEVLLEQSRGPRP